MKIKNGLALLVGLGLVFAASSISGGVSKASAASGPQGYKLVTSGPLSDGRYVITDGSDYALYNVRYNNKDEKICCETIEVSEGQYIYEPNAKYIWQITSTGDGYYTIFNETISKYISYVDGNKIKLKATSSISNNEKWTITYDSGFKIQKYGESIATSYLQKHSTMSMYGYYNNATAGSGPLKLYKEPGAYIEYTVEDDKTTLGLGGSTTITAFGAHGATGTPSFTLHSGDSYLGLVDNGDGTALVSAISEGAAQVKISLAGCDDVFVDFAVLNVATIESIAVSTLPTKTYYLVGESFDSTGLSIDVTYSDSTELVPHIENKTSGFTCSIPDTSSFGKKLVEVAYTENAIERTTSFNISVGYTRVNVTEAIEIAKALEDNQTTAEKYSIYGKVAAIDGKNVDIAIKYNETDSEKLFRLYQVASATVSELKIGMDVTAHSQIKKYVTSTKTLYETTSNPDVEYDPDVEKLVTGIEIYRSPDKENYYVGDTDLDLSGLKVKLHYNDTSKSDAIVYDDDPTAFEAMFTVTGFDTSTDGRKYLKITHNETGVYHDNDYEFSVYVNLVKPSSLDVVTKPTKLVYESGEDFDPTGIKVELVYNNGSRVDVTNSENLTFVTPSGDGKVYAEDTYVTAKYTYDTDKTVNKMILIEVNEATVSEITASLSHGYHDDTYDEGDTFSTKSLVILVHYSDSTEIKYNNKTGFDGFKIEPPDMSTAGKKNVKITHIESGKTCNVEITILGVTDVVIDTEPYRLIYRTGVKLDLNGLTFHAVYSDDSTKELDIDYDGVTITPASQSVLSTDGPNQKVTISYKNKTASFNIDVWLSDDDLEWLIAYQLKDLRDTYIEDDYTEANWALVKGYIDDAETTLSAFDAREEGNHYTSDVMVVINAAIAKISEVPTIDLKGIKVTQKPTKTVYEVGDEFDPTGMVVVAQYKSKADETLSSEDYTISGFDSSVAGYSTVVITYQGKTDSFNVTIKNKEVKTLESIEVTHLPDKDAYVIGEEFDATGLVVVAHYSNGTEDIITTYSLSGFDSSTVGEKTVTVTYENKETSFTVTVVASEEEKELANAKAQAKQQIENYYNSLDLDSLDEATRNKLLQAKQAALDAIDAATSVEEVNTAVTNGKAAMDKIIEDTSKKTKPSSAINLPLVLGLSIGGGVLLVGGALFGLFIYLKKKKPTVNPGE